MESGNGLAGGVIGAELFPANSLGGGELKAGGVDGWGRPFGGSNRRLVSITFGFGELVDAPRCESLTKRFPFHRIIDRR